MKRFLTSLFTTFAIVAGVSSYAQAQCEPEQFVDACIAETQDRGFTFVKSYKIDGQGGAKSKIEFSYVFSKDTDYLFVIRGKDGEAQGIILSIYDSNRNLIVTNFDKVNNKFYHEFHFENKKTGIYYMDWTFDHSKSYCASGVIGFKK